MHPSNDPREHRTPSSGGARGEGEPKISIRSAHGLESLLPANEDRAFDIDLRAGNLPAIPGEALAVDKEKVRSTGDAPAVSRTGGVLSFCLRAGGKALDRSLNAIAADPHAEASITKTLGRMGLDLIPFVGPVKKYADARAMFQADDILLKNEARKLFVIASLEAALDIGTMGGSAFIPDEALTYLRTARDYQRQARSFSSRFGLIPDPLSVFSGLVLKIPGVQSAVDKALSLAVPSGNALAGKVEARVNDGALPGPKAEPLRITDRQA